MLPESAVREAEILTAEREVYPPSPEVIRSAWVQDWESIARRAEADLEGFWAERAQELEWYAPWDKVLDDSNKPF